MSRDQFRVGRSSTGYRVELCRDGHPYVTFLDGLTKEGAERQVRALSALWLRISPRPDAIVVPGLAPTKKE